MEVITSSSAQLARLRYPVVTIGSFDGVHLAHQAILEEVTRRAKVMGGCSVVVTFEPHPQEFLDLETAPSLLTLPDEKQELLGSLGIDVLFWLPFTQELAQMSARSFVEKILLSTLGAREVVIGHDHAFGQGRRGGLKTLEVLGARHGFKVDALDPILFRGKPISSTRIRNYLLSGNVRLAAEMLGRPYLMGGRVKHGEGRGHSLSYPTANIEIGSSKLIPANGVYAVCSSMKPRSLHGLMNIGLRPTFEGDERTIEIHFFDFEGSLYGHIVQVQLVERIRDERKFTDRRELMDQIRRDEQVARRLLASG